MPLKDDMFSLRDKAKWKADQQVRLLNLHRSISQKEESIKAQKAHLADAAVKLYYDNQMIDETLKVICQQIQASFNEIDDLKVQEEAVRNERPPESLSAYSSNDPSRVTANFPAVAGAVSGLVCPVCGNELRGKFCPEHGVEGVMRQPAAQPPITSAASSGLICPKCGRDLAGTFCPADGSRGVPKAQTVTESEPEPEPEPPVMVEPDQADPVS